LRSIGEIVDGELNKLVVALHNPKIKPDAPQPRLGDFVLIKTNEIQIIGVVSHLMFKVREQPQPLGLPPEQVEAVLPDIEDVVYANVLKLAFVPIIGYIEEGEAYQITPPVLPDIHDEVFLVKDEVIRQFHIRNNKLEITYFPRLLKDDVENKVEVLAIIYKRLKKVIDLGLDEFLSLTNAAYEETKGAQLPTSFATTLNRLIGD